MNNLEWLRLAEKSLMRGDIPQAMKYINEVVMDLEERGSNENLRVGK